MADTDVVNDDIKACLKNVAMQVAAMSPKYVSRDEVSQEYMEHEKEILLAQAKKENPEKPENIIEKMIIGRLNKEMKEIVKADAEYLKAVFGRLEKMKDNPVIPSGGGVSLSAGYSGTSFSADAAGIGAQVAPAPVIDISL